MKIGVLKEIKIGEYRVILTPSEVRELIDISNDVYVEFDAGKQAGFLNEEYESVGAKIIESSKEIYDTCDLILKVKEIESSEYNYLRENQIIFTCIHPAASEEEVDALLEKKVISFTAEDSHRYGSPNCEVAGKLGALKGIENLTKHAGGSGKLVSGIGGSPGIKALVLGGGIAGKSATEVLSSLGAQVYLLDVNIKTLRDISMSFPKNVQTIFSNKYNIDKLLPEVDLIVNCVKWPKTRKDYLISKKDLENIKVGSVIVDVSADSDGAIESYKATTHSKPTFIESGIVHYCVDNIPGTVPYSTSLAYSASIIGHIKNLSQNGVKNACIKDGYLRRSLTTYKGILTHEETALVQNRRFKSPEVVLNLTPKDNYEIVSSAINIEHLKGGLK